MSPAQPKPGLTDGFTWGQATLHFNPHKTPPPLPVAFFSRSARHWPWLPGLCSSPLNNRYPSPLGPLGVLNSNPHPRPLSLTVPFLSNSWPRHLILRPHPCHPLSRSSLNLMHNRDPGRRDEADASSCPAQQTIAAPCSSKNIHTSACLRWRGLKLDVLQRSRCLASQARWNSAVQSAYLECLYL